MNSTPEPAREPQATYRLSQVITVGIFSWVIISLGFLGLKFLMHERPEFVGKPMRVSRAGLVLESPTVVMRKISDDLSVVRPTQPEEADVRFKMQGRRDYRGLRT